MNTTILKQVNVLDRKIENLTNARDAIADAITREARERAIMGALTHLTHVQLQKISTLCASALSDAQSVLQAEFDRL